MKKFKLILVLPLLIFFETISFGQNSYQVKGNVLGLKADSLQIIYFNSPASPQVKVIPNKNGKFVFTGQTVNTYFVQILYQTVEGTFRKLTEFMLENSDIQIVGNSLQFDSIRVVGSKSNFILKSYLDEDKALMDYWGDLKEIHDRVKETGDFSTAERIATKLNQISQVDRKAILKKYVASHKEEIIAALLPNFCLLEDQLTAEDYKDMFASLSNPIQQSNYGKELLQKSELK